MPLNRAGAVVCLSACLFLQTAYRVHSQPASEALPFDLNYLHWSMSKAEAESMLPASATPAPKGVSVLSDETQVERIYSWKSCDFNVRFYFRDDRMDHVSLTQSFPAKSQRCGHDVVRELTSSFGEGVDITKPSERELATRRQWCTPLTDVEYMQWQSTLPLGASLELSRRGAPPILDPRESAPGSQGPSCPDVVLPGPIDCTLKQAASVPMQAELTGLVSVPVQINDRTEVLGIDTGSTTSSLSYRSAALIGGMPAYKLQRKSSFVGNGRITGYTIATRFKLDTIEYMGMTIYLDPNETMSPGVDGLLGADVMSNYDVDFDFAGGRFKVFLPHPCVGKAAYWAHSGYSLVPIEKNDENQIMVRVLLDGKPAIAAIDTGSNVTVIRAGAASDLFGVDLSSPVVRREDNVSINGAPMTAYHFPFKTMTFGGVTVNNPNILILPDKTMPKDPPVIVGTSVLKQLHLYIAYKEGSLYVTAAQQPASLAPTSHHDTR